MFYNGIVPGENGSTLNWYRVIKPKDGYVAAQYITSGSNYASTATIPYCVNCRKLMIHDMTKPASSVVLQGGPQGWYWNGGNQVSWYNAKQKFEFKCASCSATSNFNGEYLYGWAIVGDTIIRTTAKPQ